MLCLIARPSRLGFRLAVYFRLVVVRAMGFWPGPRRDPDRPLPARPWRPHLPHAPLPLSISFSFPAQQLPLPLLHLSSTSFALGVIRWTVAANRRIPR